MSASIPAYVFDRARLDPDRPALAFTESRRRRETTYGALLDRVERFAAGLVAAGVRPGDRVFLLADNSPRWIVADLGILRAGAVSVPRGADTTAGEAEYILRHSGATAVVAGHPKLLPPANLASGARVVLSGRAEGAWTFEEALERGDGRPAPEAATELATIVYTSGTTGVPKGVMLTHDNILHNVRVLPSLLGIGPGDLFLSVLPSWHMFERTVEYIVLATGATLFYSGIRTLRHDLKEERPTYLAGVPRLFEGLYDSVRARLQRKRPAGRALARFLIGRAIAWSVARRRGAGGIEAPRGDRTGAPAAATLLSFLYAPLGLLGRRLAGGGIRNAMGGRLKAAISGGGMFPSHLDRFFDAMGVTILVGYGLTETSPVVTLRRPADNVIGTIGRAIPETEVAIVDAAGEPLPPRTSGEILVRGPQVMRGYYGDEPTTRAVLRPDGWLRTGDLAMMTERGDLVFTGRQKETIVLAGGENVEPAPIESRILESPFVRQVLVVGQDQKALGALVVPEPDAAEPAARARGLTVQGLLENEVRRLVSIRTGFKPRETIARIAVLPEEFTVESGTLTRTLKLRRNAILTKYERQIASLYPDLH